MGGFERIVLASRNREKAAEIRDILRPFGIEVARLEDYPGIARVTEDGDTFEENAAKKAATVAGETGEWAIADDSGLAVDALSGAPGVMSARYAGAAGDYRANNAKLLEALKDTPDGGRGAKFVCVIALADPGGNVVLTARGEVEGVIATRERGEGGFGYDPLFYYESFGATFAEIDVAAKNEVSHRARALAAFVEKFRGLTPGGQ